MIEFRQLNKTYYINKTPYQALTEIDLTVQAGEIFGIVGASGAGKSTLLRTVNLLERPTSGQVLIGQEDITKLNDTALKVRRRKIGMIFQHFNLLSSRTAFENIALPLQLIGESKQTIKQKVDELLQLVHLSQHQDHYPKQLSGGQKQRVAIARALATQPAILLCDEPTSALDANSSASILGLLKSINQQLGVTILIITHELAVIKRICDRVAVLDHGRLIEHGSVLHLFTQPKTQVAKNLVQAALHIELPAALKAKLQLKPDVDKSCLVRFVFVGKDSDLPLMTTLVKQFDLTVNIIQANIDVVQATTIGFTVCQLSGDHSAIEAALNYVKQTSISTEVLGYV